ncbi:MAG: shikimate kinase, partial [bacterium]
GFMGAGKSTIGRLLAARLERPYIDLDHHLELRRGENIATIFQNHGEAMFRRWEAEDFAQLSKDPGPYVMATGGGTFIDPMTFDLAHRTGVTIYLVVDFATALARATPGFRRPLMADGDPVESDLQLRQLFHHRLPYYRSADLHVDAAHGTAEDVVTRIVALLPPAIVPPVLVKATPT